MVDVSGAGAGGGGAPRRQQVQRVGRQRPEVSRALRRARPLVADNRITLSIVLAKYKKKTIKVSAPNGQNSEYSFKNCVHNILMSVITEAVVGSRNLRRKTRTT